jgi:hypothetical protein
MAQETGESAYYLAASKQSASLQAASAAARAKEAATAGNPPASPPAEKPASPEHFQGSEKRRSLRYKCSGSVEIREDGKDVPTWAAFTDISLHGCYVEAESTYPVGTSLHLKLDANGMRVRSKGTVRVCYPHLGMGIAFMEMAEEERAYLKSMLAAISLPSIIIGTGISSPHPTTGPMEAVPAISNPGAAMHTLIDFFQKHQVLIREDFLKLLQKSQDAATRAKPTP